MRLTICSLTVLPSSSIVRIFCEPFSGGPQRHRPGVGLTYEVDADRGDVGLGVGVVGESKQQARLAHTGITDEEQLEEVVVSDFGPSATIRRCLCIQASAAESLAGVAARRSGGRRAGLCRNIVSIRPFRRPSQTRQEAAYHSGFMLATARCDGRNALGFVQRIGRR